MNTLKQNFALIIGLAIPIVMMVAIAGVIYVPQLLSSTPPAQYDFIYAVGNGIIYPSYDRMGGYYPYSGWSKYIYRVVDGKLTKSESPPPPAEYGKAPIIDTEPQFYIHHVSSNTNETITFEQASSYTLDTSAKSPDGFEVVRGNGSGGVFPFFYSSSNYDKKYLKKDNRVDELSLNLPSSYYGEFFVAWVLK